MQFKRCLACILHVAVAVFAGASTAVGQESNPVDIELPAPWGPYAPGMRSFLVTDSTRPDTISPAKGDFRPILVRVWYPAEMTNGPTKPYMDSRTADAWRDNMPAADGFESRIRTHTYVGAPMSGDKARWPVLLFSPGRSFPVENYQTNLEFLASMGWIVAAISPPYEEALTVLPDGRALPFSGPRWETEEQRGDVLMGVVNDMVLDAGKVLDELERRGRAPGDLFSGRLDLTRGVGYMGHSLGGAAAAWTLQRDPRVTAAVSWEGQVYRDADRPLKVTGGDLLYIIGGANRAELLGTQYRPGRPGTTVHEMVIHGAWHASVGDMLYIYRRYAPRDWLERHRREVLAERVNQITDDYAQEFFANRLLGQPLDLLWPKSLQQEESPSTWEYPEVELRTYAR
jgi:hypothetical protein